MALQRSLTIDGIRHANADSSTHARHVRERKERKGINWIPQAIDSEDPAAVFKLRADDLELGNGRYFLGALGSDREVNGQEFESELAKINRERSWQLGSMSRNGKARPVRRKRSAPAIGEVVVNLSPWQMGLINRYIKEWEDQGIGSADRRALLEAWLEPMRGEVLSHFRERTGREIVGSYWHYDSNKVHLGIINTRVRADHTLVGTKSLRTIGPWSVAQSRIYQIGAGDAGDKRLQENLERFRQRHGEMPLDIDLHQTLDSVFDRQVQAIGAEVKYEQAKSEYMEWKERQRERLLPRHNSEEMLWIAMRLITPLLPPEVRTAIRVCRSTYELFGTIQNVVKAHEQRAPDLSKPSPARTL